MPSIIMTEPELFQDIKIAVAKTDSHRVCYIILPGGLKTDVLNHIGGAAARYGYNIVVLHGLNWNDCLTPWPAEGVFKEKKPFGGKASAFLNTLTGRYIPEIEKTILNDSICTDRILMGISLSGLFTIWAATQSQVFDAFASISGSLWYDGFAEWFSTQDIKNKMARVHMSLGNREKNSKDQRICTVEESSNNVAAHLEACGLAVDYQLVDATHFSPILPRIDLALQVLASGI